MKVKLKYDIKGIEGRYAEALLAERGIPNFELYRLANEDQIQSWKDLDNVLFAFNTLNSKFANKDRKYSALLVVDSDVDGFCSATILAKSFNQLYSNFEIEPIFHTAKQHGLSDIQGRVFFGHYDIVILPDAGTNDIDICAQYPQTTFLIMDHHEMEEKNHGYEPNNMIIINNQMSSKYENKMLCGAGVTWQVMRGFYELAELDSTLVYNMLDLVALATIADMMDIRELENRAILNLGLRNINNEFIRALVEKAAYSMGGEVTPIRIAFYVAPQINAMNRMGTLEEKDRMFRAFYDGNEEIESNKRGAKGTLEKIALESSRECTNVRNKQKKLETKLAEIVADRIEDCRLLDNKILVIELDKSADVIPSEINGLAANKVSAYYNRPTLIGRVGKDGFLKGSLRCPSTIDVPPMKDFLLSSGYFDYIMGHQNAAGFSLPYDKVEEMINWVNEKLADVQMEDDTWEVDFSKNADDVELNSIIDELDFLSCTWGQGNPEAQVYISDIRPSASSIQLIGKRQDTIKFSYSGVTYMFFLASEETKQKLLTLSDTEMFCIDIVGTCNMNEFGGRRTPQVFVKDFEVIKETRYEY